MCQFLLLYANVYAYPSSEALNIFLLKCVVPIAANICISVKFTSTGRREI